MISHFLPPNHMRPYIALLVTGLVACGGKATPGTVQPTSQSILIGSDVRMAANDANHTTQFSFPIDKVWKALPAAYDSIGLPLTVMDSRQHMIGNQGMKLRQKLGTVALSRYMDCGSAQNTPSADTYDVFLKVVSVVHTTDKGSELVTTMEAAAKPLTYAQEYSRCSPTGALQDKLATLVRSALLR